MPVTKIAYFGWGESLTADHSRVNPGALQLAEALAKRGIALVSVPPVAFSADWVAAHGGRYAAVHLNWLPPFYVAATPRARERRGRRFLAAVEAARQRGLRVVWTMHNVQPHETVDARVDALCRGPLAAQADAVTVHCREGARILAERYGRHHGVHVVPRGHFIGHYPNEVDRPAARRRLGIPEGVFVYVFFGALRPYKGLDALVRGFARLRGPRLRLVVAGSISPQFSTLGARLQAAARRDPRVVLRLGAVPAGEIQYLMNAADAAVLPFARVLNSASALVPLSFGRAVVAPRRGCLPEIVGEAAGVLYDPRRAGALARAMVRVRARSEAAGRAALRRARTLSWERTADGMRRAYGLARPRRRA